MPAKAIKPVVGKRTPAENDRYLAAAMHNQTFLNRFSNPQGTKAQRLQLARLFYKHKHDDAINTISVSEQTLVDNAWLDAAFKLTYDGGRLFPKSTQLTWAVDWKKNRASRTDHRQSIRNRDKDQLHTLLKAVPRDFVDYDTPKQVENLIRGLNLSKDRATGTYPIYILEQDGSYVTITYKNVHDIIKKILHKRTEETKSDDFFDGMQYGEGTRFSLQLLIPKPKPKNTGKRQRKSRVQANQGAFFPYLHNFTDPHLKEVLATLGIYSEIDPSNYTSNCLCNALLHAGVHIKIVQDIESSCIMRQVPRRLLRTIAEQHKIRLVIQTEGSDNLVRVGPNEGTEIRLGLIEGHYFHDYKTDINSWSLKNYDDIYTKYQWWRYGDDRQKVNRGIMAVKIIRILLEGNHLTQMDLSTPGIYGTQFYDRVKTQFKTLEFPESSVRLCHPLRHVPQALQPGLEAQVAKATSILEQSSEGRQTLERLYAQFAEHKITRTEQLSIVKRHTPPLARIFFDFESTTDGEKHKAYLVCWSVEGIDEIHSSYALEPGLELLQWILNEFGTDEEEATRVVLIAHNVTYDAAFLLEYIPELNTVEKGVNIICGGGVFSQDEFKVRIEFKDSQKMIAGPLRDFSKAFNLECIKEVMPYQFYTEANIINDGIASLNDLEAITMSIEDRETMMNTLEQLTCINGDHYDMLTYAEFYCKADIEVLRKGWEVFRLDTLRELGMDPNYYPTTASMADSYMELQGCYDGVFEISGVIQEFVKRCTVGGRVMVANNQPIITDIPLSDLDVNSLYPSAMIMGHGYLKGPPKVITPETDLAHADGYFMMIKINSVPDGYPFPICCLRNEINGKVTGNHWTNDLVGATLFVDKTTLVDLTYWSGVCFDMIQGYYFDEGFNTRIHTVMQQLFDLRCRLKLQDSTAQMGVKLLMNSSYGKTGLKAVDTDINYIAFTDSEQFIHNHHNKIKSFTEMPNGTFRFVVYKTIDQHFNKQHIACTILSQSKAIMNAVTCLAHLQNIPIYYTDTDSLHIEAHRMPELIQAYEERYQKKMIGDGIGQFHSDFTFKSCFSIQDNKLVTTGVKSQGEISTKRCYFLGKKSYMDVLEDESGQLAYHVRLKGIPSKCILNTCNFDYGGDLEAMFQDLYNHKPVAFNLGRDEHVMFKIRTDHSIKSIQVQRVIKF